MTECYHFLLCGHDWGCSAEFQVHITFYHFLPPKHETKLNYGSLTAPKPMVDFVGVLERIELSYTGNRCNHHCGMLGVDFWMVTEVSGTIMIIID